jgi:hypothetical protein
MPASVIADQAKLDIASLLQLSSPNFPVNLFTNNLTPGETNVIGDFVLASYPGYSQELWNTAPIVLGVDHKARFADFLSNFTGPSSGGPITVYGFIVQFGVFGIGVGRLLLSGKFAAPVVLTTPADKIVFSLSLNEFDFNQP